MHLQMTEKRAIILSSLVGKVPGQEVKVIINKESTVPIRDQLIEQIALQIASGSLKGQEKLPSIRALAQRLGIHYSTITAAYNHLAGVGLLEIRQGSGVRVAGKARTEVKDVDLTKMCEDFLAHVSESGFSREDLKPVMSSLLERKPVKRLVVVDRNKDFHAVQLAELTPEFKQQIVAVTTEEMLQNKEWLIDSLFITSLYHVFAFENVIDDRTRLIVCDIEPARSELEHVQNLKDGSLVLLVSYSQTLLNMATKLLAAQRGEQIAVRSLLTTDKTELQYMMKYASLVICDLASKEEVAAVAGKTPYMVFRLYAPHTIERIKERLSNWG